MNPFAASPSPNPFAIGVFPGYPMHHSPNNMFRERQVNPRGAVSDISPVSRPKKEDPPGIFEPPPYKTSRPPLSNIFTMFEAPYGDQKFRSKERFESPKVTPVSSTRQLTSSESTSPSNLHLKRRHSTPAPDFTPVNNPRPTRSSDQSIHSDTSSERYKRRVRRSEAVRVLPSVPRRDQNYHQVIVEEREYSPNLSKPQRKTPDSFTHATDTTDGGTSSSYYDAHPSRPQPGQQLLELEEELSVDEPYEQEPVKNFEDSFQHFYHQQPSPLMAEEVKRPGKLERKKSKKVKDKNKGGLKMPAKLDSTNDEGEIKGFDGFMMY